MMKKCLTGVIALLFLLSLAACGGQNKDSGENQTSADTPSAGTAEPINAADMFSDSDVKDVTNETPDATVTLSGSTGTLSDAARGTSGETVTITQKGVYRVTGTAENVTIKVDDETKSGNVYLILDNVTVTNTDRPCILVSDSDKVILQCVGSNALTASFSDEEVKKDAAIYAKDDLTINGSGTLSVKSGLHGIFCKNDLKVTGGTLTVDAASVGIKSDDSVRIGSGSITVTAGHDGIRINSETAGGLFYLSGDAQTCSVAVHAGYDGIDVEGCAVFDAGSMTVTTGDGAETAKDDKTSQKGVKCDGDLTVAAASLTISSPDDAMHAKGNVTISGGSIDAATADDGIHADGSITINDGNVLVSKALEGLEAETININGGETVIHASDDGLNAAGGSDSASEETGPWGGDSTGTLSITGGYLYVNAQGDGLDSNGSLYVTGGTVIVEGPTNNGNGALDVGERGRVASITGGTVLALGSTGMAVNFSEGTQCAALVALSGKTGDTVTVDDGSDFTFTAGKAFACVVYSSPDLEQGKAYTLTAGSGTATLDFTSGQFYSDVSFGMGGGPGMPGGTGGDFPGNPPSDFNGERPSDFDGSFPGNPPSDFNGERPSDFDGSFPGDPPSDFDGAFPGTPPNGFPDDGTAAEDTQSA